MRELWDNYELIIDILGRKVTKEFVGTLLDKYGFFVRDPEFWRGTIVVEMIKAEMDWEVI